MTGVNFSYSSLSGNHIVKRLEADEYRRLLPFFKAVELEPQQTLYEPGGLIGHVFFPVSCVVTMLALMNDGSTVETSLVGPEGVVGISAMMGAYHSRHWTRALVGGEALRVEAHAFQELYRACPALQKLLLRYYGVLMNQVSRRAVCNARHRLTERLCSWLLMVRDRTCRDDIPLTQEAVARQLGVRRAGVNECVGWLERMRAVDHRRGHIRILNREALEDAACPCYQSYGTELPYH